MKKTSKLLAVLLAVAMVVSACGPASETTPAATPTTPAATDKATDPAGPTTPGTTEATEPGTEPVVEREPGDGPDNPIVFEGSTYTYNDYVSTLGANWNPHTYQTTDEAYTLDYTTDNLYSFLFNETFDGYNIVPSMALSEPVDVTEAVKAAHPEFGIAENATKGYAYTIALNPAVKWDDGTPIKAQDYVESIKRLVDPKALNYRSADVLTGDLVPANINNYFYQGQTSYTDNGVTGAYTEADLVKGEDGNYYTPEGYAVYWGVNFALDWTGGKTLKDYVDAYGESYFGMSTWEQLVGMADENGLVVYNDETRALFVPVTTSVAAWGESEADLPAYLVYGVPYEADYSFDNVGLYASGEYELTLAMSKSLSGFYLLYDINSLSTFLVKTDLYDSLLKEVNDTYTSTYGTSADTSVSFGPYKITEYQQDKYVQLEKNENWWGWDSEIYVYQDPEDGLYYQMYQTDVINAQLVSETSTQREMFLSGQLSTFGLGSEDFDTYRSSDYAYVTPQATIYFFIFNGYLDVIQEREAASDFDQTKKDLETITLTSFRKAVAVSYDKELLCATISPARSGGYGILGKGYIYDPDTGAEYRNTDVARQVLCDFYSVDTSKYANLEEAVASITGYDPVAAKELYTEAFKEALELGYITDNDNDGKSDQEIEITYSASTISDFITKTMDYLNEKMAEATEGTPFEGKIKFNAIAFGNDWSDKIRSGQADTVLGGWNGSLLNPYSLITAYTNPAQSYDAKWFNTQTEKLTINVDGQDITMTLYDWGECLNGSEIDGHNFGADAVPQETRLQILAALEARILQTYDYIPMMQNAGMSLLSKKHFYVTEEYNAVMGRGGIAYLKYNYDDAEWAAYVKEQGGVLQY